MCAHGAENASICGGEWTTDDWLSKPGGYDRILVSRFDTLFHVPFLVSRLVESDALYTASWCKATGAAVQPPAPFASCKLLEFFSHDIGRTGLPDFYFAGSERVMWTLYAHWYEDLCMMRFAAPKHAPPAHGIIRGRVDYKQLKIRRYLFHDMDFDLVRNAWCNAPKYAAEAAGNYSESGPWWERSDTDVSDPTLHSELSLCEGGRYFCALVPQEVTSGCGGFHRK